MTKTCLQCNGEFKTYQRLAIYCGKICSDVAKVKRLTLICPQCIEPFERERSKSKHEIMFCSPECHKLWMDSIVKEVICEYCKTSFKPKVNRPQRFCSRKCWYAHKSIAVDYRCDHCGAIFKVVPFRLKYNDKNYCSRKCWREANRGENNSAWRGGHHKRRGQNWKEQLHLAKVRDRFICQVCHAVEDLFHHLAVHHKTPYRCFKGDWKLANRLENLVTLCDACHGRVEMAITLGRIHTIPVQCRPLESDLALIPVPWHPRALGKARRMASEKEALAQQKVS